MAAHYLTKGPRRAVRTVPGLAPPTATTVGTAPNVTPHVGTVNGRSIPLLEGTPLSKGVNKT